MEPLLIVKCIFPPAHLYSDNEGAVKRLQKIQKSIRLFKAPYKQAVPWCNAKQKHVSPSYLFSIPVTIPIQNYPRETGFFNLYKEK